MEQPDPTAEPDSSEQHPVNEAQPAVRSLRREPRCNALQCGPAGTLQLPPDNPSQAEVQDQGVIRSLLMAKTHCICRYPSRTRRAP